MIMLKKGVVCMRYQESREAKEIIDLQNEDGTWGNSFHSLAKVVKGKMITTEQALRRLWLLGYIIEDEPIRKSVDCMISCLRNERKIDHYWEKTHNWDLFTKMMLSTWIKIFDPVNPEAIFFSKHWANIIEKAFISGEYSNENYVKAYIEEFDSKPRGAREIDFVSFYQIILLRGQLSKNTEKLLLKYVISKPDGIYYIYHNALNKLPAQFQSKETVKYLAVIDLLKDYSTAKEELGFVAEWLNKNKDIKGQWDLGAKSKDGIYLPISDSWRNAEDRKSDCTKKITEILGKIG